MFTENLQYAIGASDISFIQQIVERLENRGYKEEDIKKVMGQIFFADLYERASRIK